MVGRSVGQKKKEKNEHFNFKKPGDAEPKDFLSVDLAENVGTIVNALGTGQPLKNLVSMLIKDKDITSYQLLLIKQDRVLESETCFIYLFIFSFRKNGPVGRWETKHFIGMAIL